MLQRCMQYFADNSTKYVGFNREWHVFSLPFLECRPLQFKGSTDTYPPDAISYTCMQQPQHIPCIFCAWGPGRGGYVNFTDYVEPLAWLFDIPQPSYSAKLFHHQE